MTPIVFIQTRLDHTRVLTGLNTSCFGCDTYFYIMIGSISLRTGLREGAVNVRTIDDRIIAAERLRPIGCERTIATKSEQRR